jgi:hypothetical protein
MRFALFRRNDILFQQKECLFVYKLRYQYLLKRSFFLCSKSGKTAWQQLPSDRLLLFLAPSRRVENRLGEEILQRMAADSEVCFSGTVADEANGNV